MYQGHPDQKFGPITFAQHGDDLMLLNLLSLLELTPNSGLAYLDVGAHHPINISNTALLYSKGYRGVNVEANPSLMQAFYEHRMSDKNVCVGIGPEPGLQNFYMYDETSGRNTFSKKEVFSMEGILTVRKQSALEVVTINEIVSTYCGGEWPHILSVDIEGLDLDVLKTADFTKSKPKIIVVETRKNMTQSFATELSKKGYVLYCRMGENLFFVNTKFFDKVY